MAGRLVLVTGAAGFIGSNLALRLSRVGRRVVGCDWLGDGAKWTNLRDVALYDLIRPEALPAWLEREGAGLDAIVHLGAVSATTETDVDLLVERNIRATLDLWAWAARAGVRFLYASSAATYGDGSKGFTDDDRPEALAQLRPLNAYGWSKHLVDRRIVDDWARGEPTPPAWAGLKFFNVYGPREAHKGPMRSVAHQIHPAASRGEAVSLFRSDHPGYADGAQLRDFLHVDDACAVMERMLAAPDLAGLYNVGSGRARSFADLARAMFAAVGREPQITYRDMPPALRGRYQYRTQADVTKLHAAGLAPDFRSLEEGVAAYVRDELGVAEPGLDKSVPAP